MTTAPPAYDRPPLPTFLPSTEAVDAAAKKYALLMGLGDDFDGLEAPMKSNLRSIALDLFTAAADELVVSALAHVTANHTAYGFSDALRDELIFAQYATDHGEMAEDPDEPTTL